MKRVMAFVLALACTLVLAGCGKDDSYQIEFTVPPGSSQEFVFSEEEISATGRKITISANQELGNAEIILSPVSDTITAGYVATTLTSESPVVFDATEDVWFKVGLRVQNKTDSDKTFYITVHGVEIRME